MPSTFPTKVDVIPNAGPNLTNPAHSMLHNGLRDGLAAVQSYALSQLTAIKSAGWVTTTRVAAGAITDPKIASMAAAKLDGLVQAAQIASIPVSKLTSYIFPSLTSQGDVVAVGYLRGGTGNGNPFFRLQRLGGTTGGAGTQSVPHLVGSAHLRVVGAWVSVPGNSQEARFLAGAEVIVDGTSFSVASLPAGTKWRGAMIYTLDSAAW